jgi:UDP-2-acetamido-3-amino-2,3-dideoxy-glucuronate N-acetyltransferase
MIKVACIGAGTWGVNLIRNFAALGGLHAICDTDREALKRCARTYPQVRLCDSYRDVLQDPAVQAVVLATPANRHSAMAREALEAGKDVFVEKPLALTVAEGRTVVEAAARASRVLMVGHVLQYHPAVRVLNDLIGRGELGKVQYIYSTRLNIGKVRREENILWSFAPHDVSVLLTLVGQMPSTVQATGGTYLQQGVPDVTMTALLFSNGVRGHIFVSWLHPVKEQKLVVVGDRKMAVFDDLAKDKLVLYPHHVDWIDRAPVARKAEAEAVPVEAVEPLEIECRHFLECVEQRRTPRTDGAEALRVLEVLEAAQVSLDRQGVAVTLTPSLSPQGGGEGEGRVGVFVHPTAVVDQPVEILPGTRIWHFSHVLAGSRIGADCTIGQNVTIGPRVRIGNRVKIQNNVSVYEGVTLEDFVFCGPSMVFTNVVNPRSAIPRKFEIKPTLIRYGATLGANSTIVCGVTIGRHAFIGAGAVVTGDVPDFALVVGNPARQTGWMCECGAKLKVVGGKAACKPCGAKYAVDSRRGCRRVDGAVFRDPSSVTRRKRRKGNPAGEVEIKRSTGER